MKTQKINWKRWLLIPFLCILLVLAGGCGKSGAADKGQDEEQQELQQLEAASDTPGSDVFDDQQEADAQDNADNYDPESDYGGEESEGYKQEGDSYDQDSDNDSSEQKDQSSGSGEIEENGVYTTMEDVALYIHTYGKLPLNFMTKKEAKALGWSGGSLEDYAPGMCIGGDRFGNYEGILPNVKGRKYFEADCYYTKGKRTAARIVYSSDGHVWYTEDHYVTFTELFPSGQEE